MTEIASETAVPSIWVLTDGRVGHAAQAMGLAEALARRTPARIVELPAAPMAAMVPAPVWSAMVGASPALVRRLSRWTEPEGPPPAVVIAAGRRTAPILAVLGRGGLATVQVLGPRMALSRFGHVVAPRHDSLSAPNLIETLGAMGRLTRAGVAAAGHPWAPRFARLRRPRVAVLLGGPSKAARFGNADAGRLVEALSALDEAHSLIVTPSRRTPPGLLSALSAALPGAWIWDGTGANPFPGLLAHADMALVTADSVNMCSEAACTGLPVHVFGLDGLGRRHRAFHAALEAHGAARPFDGTLHRWRYEPLAEADRVAGLLAPRLFPSP